MSELIDLIRREQSAKKELVASTVRLTLEEQSFIEELAVQCSLTRQELRVQLLEEKLRLQRISKYGPGSEKLTNLQLELLEVEPGVSNLEVAAEGERDANSLQRLRPTATSRC